MDNVLVAKRMNARLNRGVETLAAVLLLCALTACSSEPAYALFGCIAAFQLLLAAFAVYRMRVRDRVPETEKGDFVESLNEIQRVFHSDSPPTEPQPESKGRSDDE